MKKLIGLAAAAIVAVVSYFAAQTPLADALAIALDKDKAKEACAKLIDSE